MKKEQLIEILDKYGLIDENYPDVINDILALLPTDMEVDLASRDMKTVWEQLGFDKGAKWCRDFERGK